MNRSVILLTTIVGVVGSNSLVLSPIAANVAASIQGASPESVMSASALYGLGVAGAALTLAPLGDRFGPARALLCALILLAISLAASASSTEVWALSLSQTLAGIGAGVAIPSLYTLAALIAPKGKEARVIGTVLTGWTLSMVGGVTISAYVSDAIGWRWVYAGLSAAVVILLPFLIKMPLPKTTPSKHATSPLTALKVPGVLPALTSVALLGLGFYGFYNYLGAHLEVNLHRTVRDAGVLTLLYGLGFAGAMTLDGLLDRIPVMRGLASVFGSLTILYLGLSWGANSYTWLMILAPIWGALQHLGLNLTVGWLTRLDPSQRGAVMGLNSATMYLSVFLATVTYRVGFSYDGLAICGLLSALLSCVATFFVLWARHKTARAVAFAP